MCQGLRASATFGVAKVRLILNLEYFAPFISPVLHEETCGWIEETLLAVEIPIVPVVPL